MEALKQCMSSSASRFLSLQPHLMASFNRIRAHLQEQSAWLVVAEPGLLCVALLQDECWQSVRTVKVGADWMSELPGVLHREECLVDSQTECDRVFVFAPDGPQAPMLQASEWRIENLVSSLLPGMVPGADAPFSIVLGA
jgi:hypothetical protein